MEKNGIGSNQHKTCCEKFKAAVRNSSPLIRTIRFTKQQYPANHTPSSPAKVSLMTPTPLRDRCFRVSRVETTPNNPKDRCPQVSKKPENRSQVCGPNINNQGKAKATTVVQVGGHENKYPTHIGGPNSYIAQSINGMSSEYIECAGKRIRASTNVGVRKPSNNATYDSFNDRISNFIDGTKNRFHNAISFTDGSEGKGKRPK